MPTLTLKNIPDKLHARLKASAGRNRRSLNSGILVRLEQDIKRPVLDPLLQAEMLRALAGRLPRVASRRTARDEPLPDMLRALFWGYPFDDLRWPAHRDFVIARVLQSGGTDAIAWLRRVVPDVELADWIGRRCGFWPRKFAAVNGGSRTRRSGSRRLGVRPQSTAFSKMPKNVACRV